MSDTGPGRGMRCDEAPIFKGLSITRMTASHSTTEHRLPTGEELPEQLKLQGLSDQELRRSPAEPARCPELTRAVDCGHTTTTKTTKTRRKLRTGTHLSLTLLCLWQSTNLIASFLGVFTSFKFNFRHHSCFAVIEYGDGKTKLIDSGMTRN